MAEKKLTHSLLSNGLDFVNSGLAGINSKDDQQVKYGILHLFAGVVLILKERVKQEHWSLLFLKSEQANLKKYQSGDFVSIDYGTTISILENVCQIEISQTAKNSIEELRKTRNKIEHFEFEISLKTIKPTAARTLVFIVDFINKNFDTEEFTAEEDEIFEDIKTSARDFRGYIKAKLDDLAVYLSKNKKDVFHCTECFEKALVRSDDNFICFICDLNGADLENVVDTHLEYQLGQDSFSAARDGYDLPIVECKECSENSLVPTTTNYDEYICINCGDRVDQTNLQTCSRCGNTFYSEEEGSCCPSCWSDIIGSD